MNGYHFVKAFPNKLFYREVSPMKPTINLLKVLLVKFLRYNVSKQSHNNMYTLSCMIITK